MYIGVHKTVTRTSRIHSSLLQIIMEQHSTVEHFRIQTSNVCQHCHQPTAESAEIASKYRNETYGKYHFPLSAPKF